MTNDLKTAVPSQRGLVCLRCNGVLDEDGRCILCSHETWREDDALARRTTVIVDDAPSRGPEC